MAKSILISIKPRYVADILNHKKTIEVRKSMPKCDLPIDVYIYCTKEEYLYKTNKGYFSSKKPLEVGKGTEYSFVYSDEGKVVAKFTLKELYLAEYVEKVNAKSKLANKLTCLTDEEIDNYLNKKNGYGWKVDNLVIFDKPKELSKFYKYMDLAQRSENMLCMFHKCNVCKKCQLTKAPQSYMFIEVD